MTLNRRHALTAIAGLGLAAAWGARAEPPAIGRLVDHGPMEGAGIAARRVRVWLPESYDAGRPHGVLYMHDGQNLFDAGEAAFGTEWGVDEHLSRLIAAGQVPPTIVVGIDNTPARLSEYMPEALPAAIPEARRAPVDALFGRSMSTAYLDFVVGVVKPMIDRTYRVRTDAASTAVMGSSMGGLISLFALLEHPDVFGRGGCLSTTLLSAGMWSGESAVPERDRPGWNDDVAAAWTRAVVDRLPPPGDHRLYFDRGDEGSDPFYPEFHRRLDAAIRDAGWGPDRHASLYFPGDQHNEASWNRRLDAPLAWLLS